MAVTDDAIAQLKQLIVSGAIKPGDRLPREADLAESLGLSRSSLREAVRALSLLRILDVRQGDGTYVTDLAAETLTAALGVVIDFHGDSTVLEVLEVRRILEPAATARAAARMDQATVAALDEILERTSRSSTVEELVEADAEFHRQIVARAGNFALAAMLDSLSAPTQRMRVWRGMSDQGALERTFAEHRAILEALRIGDADLARSWASVHVAGVEQWLRDNLELATRRDGKTSVATSVSAY